MSQESDQFIFDLAAEPSERSSISGVDYSVNKKQLVIDGFKKSTNSDYTTIQRMIYVFVTAAILLKFVALTEKVVFAGYENTEDATNSYLQRLSRSFYYYSAFVEAAEFYSNDTKMYPLIREQLREEEKNFIGELKT